MRLRASQQPRISSNIFAVPANAWGNLGDSDNEDDGGDAEPEGVQIASEKETKDTSAVQESGLASSIYSSDPLRSIPTNGGLQGSKYSGNAGSSTSGKTSNTRTTHKSPSGSGMESMTSPSALSDSRSNTTNANQSSSSNILPSTAEKPEWSYIMSRFGAPRPDSSPQEPAEDDEASPWETTDDGEDDEDDKDDKDDHSPVGRGHRPGERSTDGAKKGPKSTAATSQRFSGKRSAKLFAAAGLPATDPISEPSFPASAHPSQVGDAAPIPEPAEQESTEYPIAEDSDPPAIEESSALTPRVCMAPSTIPLQLEVSPSVLPAARLLGLTTTTGVDVSRVIEADQKTIARLQAQVEAFESREQDQDNPLFTGTYKRKIRDLTSELQKSKNKYLVLDQRTKRLRDDEPLISSAMSAVRQMLPYTPLPSRTSEFIDRLGVKAMDLASELQDSKATLKEATDDFAARHDPEEKDPVVRSQVHRLKVANERFEQDNKNLRKLMIDHLTTFKEQASDDRETILLGHEEIESLKAQLEQKNLQIAQQTTQIQELTTECKTVKEHLLHNAEVAYAAIANFESLNKLQTWVMVLAMFLFSILPWGPTTATVAEVRGIPAPPAVEEVDDTTTTVSFPLFQTSRELGNRC